MRTKANECHRTTCSPSFPRVRGQQPGWQPSVLVFDSNLLDGPTPAPIVHGSKPAEVPPCGLVFDINLFVGLGVGGSEAMRAENTGVDGNIRCFDQKTATEGNTGKITINVCPTPVATEVTHLPTDMPLPIP